MSKLIKNQSQSSLKKLKIQSVTVRMVFRKIFMHYVLAFTFQVCKNHKKLWNLSKNEMRCAACPEYQLSLPNNANGSKYSLKKFNPSAWGGSHQKFDFVVADLLDFDKVRCCAGELKLFRLSVRSCSLDVISST